MVIAGGGVDHRQLEALLAQDGEVAGEPRDGGLGERGVIRLALVPPVGEATLGGRCR